MKVSFRYTFLSQLLTGFTRAWTILERHCPQYNLNVLVHWLSFFEHYCLQFIDSSFNHLSLPHSWSEYCLFFLLRVHYIALSYSTFQRVSRSVNVISIKYFTYSNDILLCSITFLVLESTLAFQKLCLFKSNCWNEIKEMSILKRSFEKSSFLVKDLTHIIQNIQSFDCHVFWKQKLTRCKTKMALFFWLFLYILDFDFGYIFWGSVMRWSFFMNFKKKQDA